MVYEGNAKPAVMSQEHRKPQDLHNKDEIVAMKEQLV